MKKEAEKKSKNPFKAMHQSLKEGASKTRPKLIGAVKKVARHQLEKIKKPIDKGGLSLDMKLPKVKKWEKNKKRKKESTNG